MELAIYEDCLSLIDNFAEVENTNFKTFCEQWKNISFQHIYSAQTSVVEIIQTTKTILHLCKRIVCAKDELGKIVSKFKNKKQIARRVGGLFLIYCIYFKQPTKEYVKVNVSADSWLEFINFIKIVPQNTVQADEVRYVFWKLYKNDAFRFTALDYEVGLEGLIDYDRLYDVHNGSKTNEVVRVKLKQKLAIINETELIVPEMIKIEDSYNKSKNYLIGYNKIVKTLPETKIFHHIQDTLKSIQVMLDEEHSPESAIKTESEQRQNRRELKRKASGKCHDESNRNPTTRLTNIDVGKYCGRLTVRQLMTQKLPKDLLEDLKNSSSEEDKETDETTIEHYKTGT